MMTVGKQFQSDYAITGKIGHGAFGDIYLGMNKRTGKSVAIKKESMKSKYPWKPKCIQFLKVVWEFQGSI